MVFPSSLLHLSKEWPPPPAAAAAASGGAPSDPTQVYVMGKPKKKVPIAAAVVSSESKDSTMGEGVPAPRKRGRPRKVVPEDVLKEKKSDELGFDSTKKQRGGSLKEELDEAISSAHNEFNISGGVSPDTGQNGNKPIKTEDAPTSKKPAASAQQPRREGNRRKSEPRRAAESFIQSR